MPPINRRHFLNSGDPFNDVGYLRGLIDEAGRQFVVDRKRIYLIGHSNGGFMAYRMACESADLIAGIPSLAGMTFLDPGRCTPCEPVNILHFHGTADTNVPYPGGALTTALGFQFPGNAPAFPGALQDVQIWAEYNGATGLATDAAASLDLSTDGAGLDTVVTRYTNHRGTANTEELRAQPDRHSTAGVMAPVGRSPESLLQPEPNRR